MKDGPAFQMYGGDFYIDTAEWDPYEVGVYTRLLLCEWANGSLPNDMIKLQRISGSSPKRFQKASKTVLNKFKLNGEGRYINDKMEEVRENQRKYRESQSERAKKRWINIDADALAMALPADMPADMPDACSSSSSLKDINNNRNVDNSKNVEIPKKWFKDERGNFVCFQCQKSFIQYTNLQKHFKEHQQQAQNLLKEPK